jgi:hypothetical protein
MEMHLLRRHALFPEGFPVKAMKQAPGPGDPVAIPGKIKGIPAISNLDPEALFNLLEVLIEGTAEAREALRLIGF